MLGVVQKTQPCCTYALGNIEVTPAPMNCTIYKHSTNSPTICLSFLQQHSSTHRVAKHVQDTGSLFSRSMVSQGP
jgi:hypothetical protein